MKPIYLFADSQLLFWRRHDGLFLESVRNLIERPQPKAAYIGASNGDDRDFYSLFQGAMDGIGVRDCCMINSQLSEVEAAFLNEADLILLAGGDVQRGWEAFKQNGVREAIFNRFVEGAVLIGISAGAVQLGWYGWPAGELTENRLFDTFKLVPFVVDAHDERNAWRNLRQSLRFCGGVVNGIGLPAGGGLIYHTNHTIEAIRYPAVELFLKNGEIVQSLLMPPGIESIADVIADNWIA
ncbi:MAG TPA: Type 1 glutamine amidotransferase-like domain-containing protein [Pyrinomonadaceae bacterium]|nr:Type 1 glutamine amidotransferase-like domain-containing protein [Pyrinomonadaceae bacterium]